jgi:hypothetical protein
MHLAANTRLPAESAPPVLSYMALGAAVLGLALVAVPYASLAGALLIPAGLVLGIIARRRGQRNIYTRLALILSGLGLAYILGVAGLLIFF